MCEVEFRYLTADSLASGEELPASVGHQPDPDLKHGQVLSKDMVAKLATALKIGVALAEVDPYYKKRSPKTFIVVEKSGTISRYPVGDSLNCLSPFSAFRRFNIMLLHHWMFIYFMIAVVLLNAVDMILVDGIPGAYLEFAFLTVYVFEFLLKVLGRGFFKEPFACLRMPWNWLDVFVIMSFFTIFSTNSEGIKWFSLTESVRLLKIIPLIPGLRMEFESLLTTVRAMVEYMVLVPLAIFVFSLGFIQLFMGTLGVKCLKQPYGSTSEIFRITDAKWDAYASDQQNWLKEADSSEFRLCGNGSGSEHCPEGYICVSGFGPNPAYDLSSFDNVLTAYLSTVRMITLDFWEQLYGQLLQTAGTISFFSYLIIFLFGTFPIGCFAYSLIADSILKSKRHFAGKIQSTQAKTEPSRYSFIKLCPTWSITAAKPALICYEYFVTFTILVDIIFLAVEHAGIERKVILVHAFNIWTMVAFFIYFVEFWLKFVILSPNTYFKTRWNYLDLSVILLWMFNVLAPVSYRSSFFGLWIMVRTFKLAPRLPKVVIVFRIFRNAFNSVSYLFTLVLMFIVIFSLIGASLHGANYNAINGEMSRWNYTDFFHAVLLVFRMLCGEWIETLWDTMFISTKPFYAVIFTAAVVIMGYFILTNLAVSIILTTVETMKSVEAAAKQADVFYERFFKRMCLQCKTFYSKFIARKASHGGDLQVLDNEESDRHRRNSAILGWKTYFQFSTSPWLLRTSITIVVLSTLILLPSRQNYDFCFIANLTIAVYFCIELVVRTISGGIKSFDAGRGLDILIIVELISTLSIVPDGIVHYKVGYLRLQCLRPLMLISRVEGLQVVLKGICKEFSLVWRYVFSLLFIWLGFGLAAMQMYGSAFFKCLGEEINRPDYRIAMGKIDCEMSNMTWANSLHNFDHVGQSFVSMLSVSTFSGWLQIIADATDTRYVDEHEHYETNYPQMWFFLSFIVFGVYIPLQILVGIVVHYLRKPEMFGIFMTETQRGTYVHGEQNPAPVLRPPIIPRPESAFQGKIYDFVARPVFEKAIIGIICVDLFSTAFEYRGMPANMEQLILYVRTIISVIYVLEFFLKILAWHLHYFKKHINILDFFVVLDCITFLLANPLLLGLNFPYFLRPFRIVRIFKYSPARVRFEKTRLFGSSIWQARHSLINLITCYGMILMFYSLVGYAIFHNVSTNGFSAILNYNTTGGSFLTTFQLFAIRGWDVISLGFLKSEDECPDCLYYLKGTLFIMLSVFTSFVFVVNMYIVLTMECVKQLKCPEVSLGEETSALPEIVDPNNALNNGNEGFVESAIPESPDSTVEVPL